MDTMIATIETGAVATVDIGGMVDRFVAALDVTETSRDAYRRNVLAFLEWLKAEGETRPTRETILAYKRELIAREVSSLTLSAYLVAVRRFFAWAESEGLYPNVAASVKGAKQSRQHRKDALTVGQARDLLSSIDRGTLEGKRDYALLSLLLNTALRTIEVERASVGDIRQEGGNAVLWIQGKGRDAKDAFVVLTDSVLRAVNEYLAARGNLAESDPLFTTTGNRGRGESLSTRSIRRIVKERLHGISLVSGRLTAHSLRHTGVTLALMGGASIQEAQALARHADINTTLIYAHNLNRLNNAPERAIERLLSATA